MAHLFLFGLGQTTFKGLLHRTPQQIPTMPEGLG
jgi:hypothetical protein